MTIEVAPDQDLIWRQKVIPTPVPPGCSCVFNAPTANFGMAARATVGDQALACNVPLQQTPADLYAYVMLNGAEQTLGADRVTSVCFFSADGGATASTIGPGGTIAAGDQLYWNGSVAGFDLATTDVLTFGYFYTT